MKQNYKTNKKHKTDVGAGFVSAHGITLISLIITIVILIILAGVTINLTLGENGIFNKAKEAKKAQVIAEAKEKIGTEILSAQVEAVERDETLEQTQIEDIILNYGELQEDGDTITLNDNGYEVSLKEIYSGTVTSTGSYSELKAKVALLEQQLEDSSLSESEANKELSELKTVLSQITATETQILKDYTAYKDGELITGTMENRGELNWNPSGSESYTVPAGYYSGGTLNSSDAYNAGKTSFNISTIEFSIPFKKYYTSDTNSIATISLPKSGLVLGETCFVVCDYFASGYNGGELHMQYSISGATLTVTGTVTYNDSYWGKCIVYCIC